MGEAVLGAILPVLLEKLADREVLDYFGRIKGVDKKVLQKWTQTLTEIEAVLSDAEEKQLTQRGVKEWLDDLRDLAYDVQDILDIFDTKMLKRRIQGQQGRKIKLRISSLVSEAKSNFSLNSAIKHISDRLDELTAQEKKFGLKNLGVPKKPWKMPPTTCQLDGPVIGRDEAKATILDKLLSEQEHCINTTQNYHVVAIVGTGGLGKTTLAKHIFNNPATDQFSVKGWVCVSDDFDIVRVTLAVLESVTSAPVQDLKELNSIQVKLGKELAGKKFLIVLDDVWRTCSYSQWTTLQSSFCFGAAGSKIIVTTRDANVAKMTGDNNPYRLEPMSADDCWKIFEHHALLNNRPQDVEFLKEKIVIKCSGLPLAASTLGGLLRCKGIDEWEAVLDHKMWDQVDILPALKLSYHYLPSNLKRCFSYCAILPYDYVFEEMKVILWWMAEGLVLQQPGGNRQMEDLGRDYFQELVSRSLFQRSSKDNSRYIMHDLVTDLARWAAGSTCSRLEDMKNSQSRSLVRHSSYILGHYDGVEKFGLYSETPRLRTFLPLSLSNFNFLKLVAERLLQLQILDCRIKYMRLSKCGSLLKVPERLHHLTSLQTLHINECANLVSLPDAAGLPPCLQIIVIQKCDSLLHFAKYQIPPSVRRIHIEDCEKLKSLVEKEEEVGDGGSSSCLLEHLNIWNCPSLIALLRKDQLPRALKELRIFNCGQLELIAERFLDDTFQLETIDILRCPSLTSLPEGLCHLTNLQSLRICSCKSLVMLPRMSVWPRKMSISDCEKLELLSDMMHSADSVKELEIDYCEGLTTSSFPPSLTSLTINNIKNCKALMESQVLQRLTSLRQLHLFGEDDGGLVSFPPAENSKDKEMLLPTSLVELAIVDFPNLKKLSKGIQFLTSLEVLHIWNCPKLATLLPVEDGLPHSLTQLFIRNCPLLEERYKGRYRNRIAHIPCVQIN